MTTHKTRWTKAGQPVMGTVLRLPQTDADWWPGRIVGKLYGHGGSADLIGVIVEAVDDGERYKFAWPLASGEKQYTRDELSWEAS